MSLALIEASRPLNNFMTALSVLIGSFLVVGVNLDNISNVILPIALAMASAFLISAAGYIINDYTDIESDKVNRPRRPIPSGRLKKSHALRASIAMFVVGIIISGFINLWTLSIAIFNSALLISYSFYLQNKSFVGNLSIAYLVGSGFLFGGAALANLKLPVILMILALLAIFSREIVKDLEDLEGDKLGFLKTISKKIKTALADKFGIGREGQIEIRYNKKLAKFLAILSLILAIIISPAPYFLGMLGLSYLVMLIPTDGLFLLAAAYMPHAKSKKRFHRISRHIKTGTLFGLLAFIVGILF